MNGISIWYGDMKDGVQTDLSMKEYLLLRMILQLGLEIGCLLVSGQLQVAKE